MKKKVDGWKVSRRQVLGMGPAGLALMGLPMVHPENGERPSLERGKARTSDGAGVDLAQSGQATAALLAPKEPSVLGRMAEEAIVKAVARQADSALPVFRGASTFQQSRSNNLIAIGTPQTSPLVAYLLDARRLSIADAGDDGYSIQTWKDPSGNTCLLIASGSDKGVYHGATHVADFLAESRPGSVSVPPTNITSRPAIHLRGTYNLACWGLAPRYSLEDWKGVIDAMVEDRMNFVYFWLAGLFRSKIFPESFIYRETPLTNDDIHALIKYAQDRGVAFYLGAGAFAWFGEDEIGMYHPETRELEQPHLCRTLPASRKLINEYLTELYDSFPEVDGMYLEIGCEGDYHCTGPLCQKPLDAFGSKQIGESEISFLQEFSKSLWKRNPKLKFVWPIGYPSHEWDVKYYEIIRERMSDDRYLWMETRQHWYLPDSGGTLRPLKYFSKNILHWDQYYAKPLLDICDRARRIVDGGLSGYAVAFEPGFATASIYGNRIPFPVNILPYRLTRFAYREFTWDPYLTWDQFKARTHKKFFLPQMSDDLVDIMVTLREFMREGPASKARPVGSLNRYGSSASRGEITAFAQILKPRLADMESRLNYELRKVQTAPPEGAVLIRSSIHDLRAAYEIP